MTTIFEEEVTCAVRGAKQTVQETGSTNSFVAMDLDTRLPVKGPDRCIGERQGG